ncbi:MAG: hypothetical protein NZ899_01605 [Thermoguttaceae bacterium]|nr:hypothetical protein [Thermoguttaceae bacterium]MDW8078630.1 hypothetical protein [Thermoguttaceae bacterium]
MFFRIGRFCPQIGPALYCLLPSVWLRVFWAGLRRRILSIPILKLAFQWERKKAPETKDLADAVNRTKDAKGVMTSHSFAAQNLGWRARRIGQWIGKDQLPGGLNSWEKTYLSLAQLLAQLEQGIEDLRNRMAQVQSQLTLLKSSCGEEVAKSGQENP